MKQTIWKFETLNAERFTLKMPKGAQILSVQTQHEQPCIWALVNPENDIEERFFELFGTGHEMDNSNTRLYIGTYQLAQGVLVLHLFERLLK